MKQNAQKNKAKTQLNIKQQNKNIKSNLNKIHTKRQ